LVPEVLDTLGVEKKVLFTSVPTDAEHVQVERTPWCDDFISPETNLLLPALIDANRHGFLTINSQPRVNAAPSTDPVVGWGNPGGYIFQKVTVDCLP